MREPGRGGSASRHWVLVGVGEQLPPVCLVRGTWGTDFGSTRSYERAAATRFMSVPLGEVASCAPGRFALGQTRSGLGVWVASPRGSGASKAAGASPFLETAQRRRLGGAGARRGLTDFHPPGC
jgi:hypothetical protein